MLAADGATQVRSLASGCATAEYQSTAVHVVATLSKDYLCDAYAIMAIDNAGCDTRHRTKR